MRRKIRKELKERKEKACDTVDSSLKEELPTTGNVYVRLGTKVRQGRRRDKMKNFKKRTHLSEKKKHKRRKIVRYVAGEKNQKMWMRQQRNMLILMYKQERKQTYECWKGKGRGERTALEKKEEQEAGKIAISDLLLGGRAFFIWY
jgi:hypothetical protein